MSAKAPKIPPPIAVDIGRFNNGLAKLVNPGISAPKPAWLGFIPRSPLKAFSCPSVRKFVFCPLVSIGLLKSKLLFLIAPYV